MRSQCNQNGSLRLVEGIRHGGYRLGPKGCTHYVLREFRCWVFHDLHSLSFRPDPYQSDEPAHRQEDLQWLYRLLHKDNPEGRCHVVVAWIHPYVSMIRRYCWIAVASLGPGRGDGVLTEFWLGVRYLSFCSSWARFAPQATLQLMTLEYLLVYFGFKSI
jgi:hypothetical protein